MAEVPLLWKTSWLLLLSSGSQLHLNGERESGPSRTFTTAGKDSSGWEMTSGRLSGVTNFTSWQSSVTSTTSTSRLDGNFNIFFLTVRKHESSDVRKWSRGTKWEPLTEFLTVYYQRKKKNRNQYNNVKIELRTKSTYAEKWSLWELNYTISVALKQFLACSPSGAKTVHAYPTPQTF